MADIVITGASRGIGRALALALASSGRRLVLVARDADRLRALSAELEAQGGSALVVQGDLSTIAGARALGEHLRAALEPDATLVHNAGLWPARPVTGPDGLEAAFVINHLGPLAMQRVLLQGTLIRRVMVVSAGLIALGRFDRERTPVGADFSALRTYCTTKLCFALAMRDVASAHPELDVVVLHPGVVRTDLGARDGWLGRVLALVKRRWESPEVCGARLARVLQRERWSPPGDARWMMLDQEAKWPAAACKEEARRAVREVSDSLLGET